MRLFSALDSDGVLGAGTVMIVPAAAWVHANGPLRGGIEFLATLLRSSGRDVRVGLRGGIEFLATLLRSSGRDVRVGRHVRDAAISNTHVPPRVPRAVLSAPDCAHDAAAVHMSPRRTQSPAAAAPAAYYG